MKYRSRGSPVGVGLASLSLATSDWEGFHEPEEARSVSSGPRSGTASPTVESAALKLKQASSFWLVSHEQQRFFGVLLVRIQQGVNMLEHMMIGKRPVKFLEWKRRTARALYIMLSVRDHGIMATNTRRRDHPTW